MLCEASSPAGRRRHILHAAAGLATGLALAAVVLIGMAALAAEAPAPPGTSLSLPDQVKDIATGSGALERPLIGLLLTVVGLMFGLLMKAWSDRRADVEKGGLTLKAALEEREKEHLAEIKAKDTAHAADRAEWYAATTLLQEARVGMIREVLTALTNSTAAIQGIQGTIAERTQTIAELIGIVREFATSLQSFRKASEDDAGRMHKRIGEALDALDKATTRRP